jgi:hypothetical protein
VQKRARDGVECPRLARSELRRQRHPVLSGAVAVAGSSEFGWLLRTVCVALRLVAKAQVAIWHIA